MHASVAPLREREGEMEKLLLAETCRFAAELNSLRGPGDTRPTRICLIVIQMGLVTMQSYIIHYATVERD